MKNLVSIFLTFFIFTGAVAQYHTFKSRADKAFNNKNYYEAAYYYDKAAGSKKSTQTRIPFTPDGKITKEQIKADRPYILYRLAESYRLYEDYSKAGEWYKVGMDENNETDYPLTRLWYGVCLRADKRFDESITQLSQFIAVYKDDKEYIDLAKKEIAVCLFAKEQYNNPEPVNISRMEGQWNGGGGDYALVKNGGDYWFTSTRFAGNDKKHLNKIYTVSAQNPATPAIAAIESGDKGKNAEYGTLSMDASGRQMYLTRWYKDGDRTILAIYHSGKINAAWSVPQRLNTNVNADGYNALQPFVTADGKRLFFVSDMPGGQGGYDIWMSNLDGGGNPTDAVNLGTTINTPDDDEAPFYDDIHQKLIYSSKGFIGLGGFDLFESFQSKGQWSSPANLGYPINSSKDDLYYFADPDDRNKFYISSDRESECCLNLFQGYYKQQFVTGSVVDCDTRQPLPGVKVTLTDSASGQTVAQSETGAGAKYIFEISAKHSYKLTLEKSGYFTKNIIATANPRIDTLINPEICLQAFKVDKPIVVKNILYDSNKATLRPESQIALDGLVTIMRDNPNIKIVLASYTDSVGSDAYNLKLSQQRAQSCADYIISKGIAPVRIVAKGYGEAMPIAPNSLPNGKDNPDGRQLNRRTEFTVKK